MNLADQLNWRPATELARLIRSKAVSPVELLRSCLQAIERLNPKINAICTLAADSAMAAARRAEQAVMSGQEIGLLHGVPIGIKDLTPTAGIRTTFGSPLYSFEGVRAFKAKLRPYHWEPIYLSYPAGQNVFLTLYDSGGCL